MSPAREGKRRAGWQRTIAASFLPEAAQSRYLGLLQERRERLFGAAV